MRFLSPRIEEREKEKEREREREDSLRRSKYNFFLSHQRKRIHVTIFSRGTGEACKESIYSSNHQLSTSFQKISKTYDPLPPSIQRERENYRYTSYVRENSIALRGIPREFFLSPSSSEDGGKNTGHCSPSIISYHPRGSGLGAVCNLTVMARRQVPRRGTDEHTSRNRYLAIYVVSVRRDVSWQRGVGVSRVNVARAALHISANHCANALMYARASRTR